MTTELLKRLINAIGPSGDEKDVRNIIYKAIKHYVDEIWVDNFGNLIAHKKGTGPKVALASHMDEIGLMVEAIENNGLMRIAPIGGIEPITLVGQTVHVLDENNKAIYNGVISFRELSDDNKIKKIPSMDELFVDVGLSKKDLKKSKIVIGSYIVPTHSFSYLGDKHVISGKALDDRIGCYILIETAKRLKRSKKSDVFFVFTVQEEVGLYGAKTSIHSIKPDWGIAVDVTNARDAEIIAPICLGAGPFLTIKDAEMISNKCLNDWIKKLAKKSKIILQYDVVESGTTDAVSIMLSHGGVPSTVLSVAVRNLHSTIGIANLDDIENVIKLLNILLKDPLLTCEV